MSTAVLIDSIALWIAILVLAVFLVGTMRGLAESRSSHAAAPSVKDDGPIIGSSLPRLVVSPVNGKPNTLLTDYQGQQGTLLAMLSPLCESCQDLASTLNALHRLYGDRVGIVAVLDGGAGVGRSFLGMFPLTCPTILDDTGEVTRVLGVVNKPSGLLYDAHGVLITKAILIDENIVKEVIDDVTESEDQARSDDEFATTPRHVASEA